MHPFDLKTALLAKHAQHVVLIHFPIALFITGVAFDLCGRWFRHAALTQAAYFNLLIAAFATVPTVASGLAAWQWQLEGQKLKGILLSHLMLGCASSVVIWLVWWLRHRQRDRSVTLPTYVVLLELLGVALVALTGHLGGFLSGVNLPS
jgi:uncharacterized membrane protein